MNRELHREIENMRLKSQYKVHKDNESIEYLNPMICLLFRCFLAFVLFICGIVFPAIQDASVPQEIKDLPVYISSDYGIEEMKEFMDGMAN